MTPKIKKHELTPELKEAYLQFLQSTPPSRLSRGLRHIFLDYLVYHHQWLPLDFHEILLDLNKLFDLLDHAARETKDWYEESKENK
jgi:hypothetical protein